MKKILLAVLLLSMAMPAAALELAGVVLEKSVTVHNKTLTLNGAGIRKKFFVKVYVGALYSTRYLSSGEAALQDNGDKLIRMRFLHSRVDRQKIVDAFAEGINDNTPSVAGTPDAKRFLGLFRNDFVRGDTVDLFLGADGTVAASANGVQLGLLRSPMLARAILSIYLGGHPADADLKAGMLGSR